MTAYEWVIVVCAIIWTVMAVGGLAAAIILLGAVKRQFTRITQKADSVLDEARRLVHTSAEAASHVASRATSIADKAEKVAEEARQTAETVADQVTAATGVIRDAVSEPVVGAAAALSGVKKGIEAWLRARKPKEAP